MWGERQCLGSEVVGFEVIVFDFSGNLGLSKGFGCSVLVIVF